MYAQDACTNVTNNITDAMDIHTWKACVKETGDKVWFDDHCTCAATKKRRLFRKLKKMNTKANKDKFTKARKEFNHTEKIAKRRYNNKLKGSSQIAISAARNRGTLLIPCLESSHEQTFQCLKMNTRHSH